MVGRHGNSTASSLEWSVDCSQKTVGYVQVTCSDSPIESHDSQAWLISTPEKRTKGQNDYRYI